MIFGLVLVAIACAFVLGYLAGRTHGEPDEWQALARDGRSRIPKPYERPSPMVPERKDRPTPRRRPR